MKKLLLLAALTFVTVGAYAQGYLNFANAGAGVNAPVRDVSSGSPGVLASGAAYQVQLYVGPAGIAPGDTLNAGLTTNGVSGTPSPFLSGGQAGYFTGGQRTIAGSGPGTILSMQVRAWATSAGASWEAASALRGESQVIQLALGGPSPAPAPNMAGLQAFNIGVVPEPSSIALGLLGLGAIVLFRRRK